MSGGFAARLAWKGGAERHADAWRPLLLFGGYRLALAFLFAALFFSGTGPRLLGEFDPRLFALAALSYLAFSALALTASALRRPAFGFQVYLQLAVDVAAIATLMHASGGIRSGLGMLLIAAIAGGGLLLAGRMALLFAALASLAVLGEQVYAQLNGFFFTTYYTQGGILGAAYFATALLAQGLAGRVRESEALAMRRGVDLANMEQLNAYIIRHLEAGIVVADSEGRVRLLNDSAAQMIGVAGEVAGRPLAEVAPELFNRLADWRVGGAPRSEAVRLRDGELEVLPRFARMGEGPRAGCLVLMEETAALAEQAQRVKLASLGRLTASIAHEVRNPLGAISHAGQLLAESPDLGEGDRRLTEIIRDQSKRVNAVIENVLRISRREAARPDWLELAEWGERFAREFVEAEGLEASLLTLEVPAGLRVYMDAGQLHQVVWNLCRNALVYGREGDRAPRIVLRGGEAGEHGGPWLEVEDEGPGIPEERVEKIFEPFYTESRGGTGLGLYLARELCEANQAHLGYRRAAGGGACFRVSFSDPERQRLLR